MEAEPLELRERRVTSKYNEAFLSGQTEYEIQNSIECFALLKRG